jgi:hypothetical protein
MHEQNVDKLDKWVTDIESPNAQGSSAGPYSIGNPALFMRSSAASISSTSIDRLGVGVKKDDISGLQMLPGPHRELKWKMTVVCMVLI